MKTAIYLFVIVFSISTAWASGDTITTETGLKYVQVKAGDGNKPKEGSKVRVTYTGRLEDGTVFDSMNTYGVFKFTIGDKDIIPGWNEGFLMMSKGEKAILIVPPHLAYGKRGVKDPENERRFIVPPNATLIFEVELISFK
ncbi:MAG TPA: FKBP-type peptidyl-prolyl cis-trans isomerase [Cytophagaceae bacterium]